MREISQYSGKQGDFSDKAAFFRESFVNWKEGIAIPLIPCIINSN